MPNPPFDGGLVEPQVDVCRLRKGTLSHSEGVLTYYFDHSKRDETILTSAHLIRGEYFLFLLRG